MKIVKLSGSQTTVLANLGVDVTADVLVPFDKGAGSYTFCTYCFHQQFSHEGQEVIKICGNPVVTTGLATSQCYYKDKPLEEEYKEFTEIEATTPKHYEGGEDVPEDDLDRSFLVTGDGANPAASADVQGDIEKSTFHPQGGKGDEHTGGDTE